MVMEYELLQSLTKHLKVKLKIKVISGIERSVDLLNRGEGICYFSINHYQGPYRLPCFYRFAIQYLSGAGAKNPPIGDGCHHAGRALAYQKPRRPDR